MSLESPENARKPEQPLDAEAVGSTASGATESIASSGPAMRYRCSCGCEIELTSLAEKLPEKCPACGHRLPKALGNDPTMTLSFCSLPLDATTDLLPQAMQSGFVASTPVRSNTVKPASPQHANRSLRSGERLGHFVLQEPLGQGGMGAVYRALDTSLQRYVAVKVLRDGGEGSSGTTAKHTDRLRQEAVSQARLNHPRVVTIYYVGREEEEPFLAMELLPGPTLQERLLDGPLPYDELIEYAMQVTDALEAADQSGMVHGDIKPSNLLMAGVRSIKLSDFGLARRSGSSSQDGSVSGTPYYIAPELLDGDAPNIRTDMYALGVTLFELAFGRRPFELSGDTLREQLLTHRTAEIEFPQKWPSEIPEPFRDVLEQLLAKRPEERYSSYATLRNDLRSVCPIGSTLAGVPARLIAWVADSFWIGIMQIPFILLLGLFYVSIVAEGPEWFGLAQGFKPAKLFTQMLEAILSLSLLLSPLFALWWELKRYRTPGRYLMQIRVVDKYGLPPSRRMIVTRNFFRFILVWTGVAFALFSQLGVSFLSNIGTAAIPLWLLIDFLPVFGPRKRAIHDLICDTHVVLDERSVHQRTARVSPGTMIHSY